MNSFTDINQVLFVLFRNTHKSHTDLEARAKPAVTRAYVENQAILEPVLLFLESKCKQTPTQGSMTVYGSTS